MMMWNPWRLFDELDRTFMSSSAGPAQEIEDTEDETQLTLDVPGMTEDDIEITVAGQLLSVRGERKGKRATSFTRSYHLGDGHDLDQIRAHVSHGVLTITIAKAAKAKPRRIKLTTGVVDKVKGLLGNGKDKREAA